jgi:hypothetical protein
MEDSVVLDANPDRHARRSVRGAACEGRPYRDNYYLVIAESASSRELPVW